MTYFSTLFKYLFIFKNWTDNKFGNVLINFLKLIRFLYCQVCCESLVLAGNVKHLFRYWCFSFNPELVNIKYKLYLNKLAFFHIFCPYIRRYARNWNIYDKGMITSVCNHNAKPLYILFFLSMQYDMVGAYSAYTAGGHQPK